MGTLNRRDAAKLAAGAGMAAAGAGVVVGHGGAAAVGAGARGATEPVLAEVRVEGLEGGRIVVLLKGDGLDKDRVKVSLRRNGGDEKELPGEDVRVAATLARIILSDTTLDPARVGAVAVRWKRFGSPPPGEQPATGTGVLSITIEVDDAAKSTRRPPR